MSASLCLPASQRFSGRALTVLLACLTGTTALSIDMNLPAMPELAVAFGAPVSAAQLTLSLFLLGFAIGQLICGPVSDRVGRRPVLMAGLAVFTAAGVLCALSPTLGMLLAGRFLQGLGGSVGPVLARAVVRDLYDQSEASGILSQMTQVMIVAPLLAPLLGGYLLVWFGWHSIFAALAVCGALLAWVCWGRLPETVSPRHAARQRETALAQDLRLIVRHRPTVRHMLTSCLAYAGMFAYISGLPFVAHDVYHVARQHFGYVFAVTALALMAGATWNRVLVARHAPLTLLRRALPCLTAAGLLMLLLSWWGQGQLAGLVGPMMLYMLGQGLVQPNAMACALAPHGRSAGLASSLMGSLQTAGGALAGYCAALFYNGTSLSMAATVAVLATLSFLSLDRKTAAPAPAVDTEREADGDLVLLEGGA